MSESLDAGVFAPLMFESEAFFTVRESEDFESFTTELQAYADNISSRVGGVDVEISISEQDEDSLRRFSIVSTIRAFSWSDGEQRIDDLIVEILSNCGAVFYSVEDTPMQRYMKSISPRKVDSHGRDLKQLS